MSAASRTLRLYPETSSLPLQAIRNFHGLLTRALEVRPYISVSVSREGFTFGGEPFGQDSESLKAFATDLYAHQVSAIDMRSGINEREILEFLKLLMLDPMVMREQGGISAMLLGQQVSNLMVDELELRVVEDDSERAKAATEGVAMGLVDDVADTTVDAVEGFFISLSSSVPEMVEWLRSVSPLPTAGQSPAETLVEAVRQLGASIASSTELPYEQAIYFRNITEGILALDEGLRSDVVCSGLIPNADASRVYTKILSQFTASELAELLSSAAEDSLGRTCDLLGDLSVLGEQQGQVFSLLEQMLFEKGHSQEEVDQLRDVVRGAPEREATPPIRDEVVEILRAVSEYTDGDLKAIQSVNESAAPEQTDVSALRIRLSLIAGAEDEPTYVELLEGLGPLLVRLVEHGYVELAGQSLDWASAHARAALKLWPSVSDALRSFGDTVGDEGVVACLVDYLRQRSADRDVRAVAHFVSLLPDQAIEHVVDALAEEKSMAVRKRLCAVFSGTGRKAIRVLGTRLSDPRWYLVRNVVSVFGMMRDRDALPYLRQTLEHPDARVRAETVRSIGMIRDASAAPWLVERLTDPDATVRVSSARWLGRMHATEAVGTLCQIAESRAASDADMVKVTIQALAQIGGEEAQPTLQRLASRRSIFRRRQIKEIRDLAANVLADLQEESAEVKS